MLHINFEDSFARIRYYIVVCIKRGNRQRIAYNSGLLYFYHKSAVEAFIKEVSSNKQVEVFIVNPYKATLPNEDGATKKGYWCPYCRSWEYWVSCMGGYKKCPICGISNNDFHVKGFNNLWEKPMQSKSNKKKLEKTNKKSKRRSSE